ncbi:MAG: UDP-N-acetylmuramoyl-L-alanine--D-glutamate ligase [Fibrobacteria bacterium]|nr:UDP-N-acetylmuramoyl-L-alanine--D-glutamate ligase [Fibrobacteria bacterium]
MALNYIKKLQSLIPAPVGILGFGVEGQSTFSFLKKHGYKDIFIFDRNLPDSLPEGCIYKGDNTAISQCRNMRTLFRSAGIRPDIPEIKTFVQEGGLLSSQIELVFGLVPHSRLIGVTGTLGKGTCCSLLKTMLDNANIRCALGGNIGIAALDLLTDSQDDRFIILELSSFQLSSLSASPKYAVVLKTTSEHLDWHTSQQEYWEHKANLVKYQSPDAFTIYCDDAPGSTWIGARAGGQAIPFGVSAKINVTEKSLNIEGMVISSHEPRMPGTFNLQNIAAAASIALKLGASPEAVKEAAMRFRGLEHRLEFAGKNDFFSFYNDSYATRPEAVIGALKSFENKKIGLILGGSEKFADFTELAQEIVSHPHISAIALIGDTAPRLQESICKEAPSKQLNLKICPDLDKSLQFLTGIVKNGVILLSPGCASFGLFKNYKERGKIFKKLVRNYSH